MIRLATRRRPDGLVRSGYWRGRLSKEIPVAPMYPSLMTAACLAIGTCACAGYQSGPDVTAPAALVEAVPSSSAPASSTTEQTGSSTQAMSPDVSPTSAANNSSKSRDQQVAAAKGQVLAAIDSNSLCHVYRELAKLPISSDSTKEFKQSVDVLVDLLKRSLPIVPPEVADGWNVLIAKNELMSKNLANSKTVTAAGGAIYSSAEYVNANDSIKEWISAHCQQK